MVVCNLCVLDMRSHIGKYVENSGVGNSSPPMDLDSDEEVSANMWRDLQKESSSLVDSIRPQPQVSKCCLKYIYE